MRTNLQSNLFLLYSSHFSQVRSTWQYMSTGFIFFIYHFLSKCPGQVANTFLFGVLGLTSVVWQLYALYAFEGSISIWQISSLIVLSIISLGCLLKVFLHWQNLKECKTK